MDDVGGRAERGERVTLAVGRALADPTRLAVLRHIQRADAPVGVRELAQHFGLHPNSIRKHLAHLVDSELIVEHVERRGQAGRPPLGYCANPDSAELLGGWNAYELLASLLVEIADGRDAHEVGLDYGARVASAAPESDELELMVGTATRHGFDPVVVSDRDHHCIVLRRCPFASAVRPSGIVCELHRGIADGIARTRGTRPIVLDVAAPGTGPCRYRLPTPSTHRSDTSLPRAATAVEASR